MNSLMELRPKKIVDKLARPGVILIAYCLILENEVCKEKKESFIQVFENLITT